MIPRWFIATEVCWLQRLAQWCAARGWFDPAISLFHSCLGRMQRLSDPKGEGIMHHNLGLAHQLKGDVRGAMVHYSRALSLEELAGDSRHMAQSLLSLGGCHRELGDAASAKECFSRAYLRAIQAEFPLAQAASCQFSAELAEQSEDVPGALEHWGRLVRIGEQQEQPRLSAYAHNQRARLNLETGALTEAWSEAEAARTVAERERDLYNLGLAFASLGELCMRDQAWSRALEFLTRAEKLLQRQGGDQSLRVRRRLAEVHRMLGNEMEARKYTESPSLRTM